jgi:hypothetical protein
MCPISGDRSFIGLQQVGRIHDTKAIPDRIFFSCEAIFLTGLLPLVHAYYACDNFNIGNNAPKSELFLFNVKKVDKTSHPNIT